jgi:hypothetical protein
MQIPTQKSRHDNGPRRDEKKIGLNTLSLEGANLFGHPHPGHLRP